MLSAITGRSDPPTAAPVTVEPVGRAGLSAFIGFPYRLYRGDPLWVPPLRRDCRRLLSRKRNPFFEYGSVGQFLARRGRGVVGRIAAVHNPRQGGGTEGFFGQFECRDDSEAAAALVDAAAGWLRERGLTSMTGPVNFTTNDEIGTLIEGFDSAPTIMTAYNPPYYTDLLHGCGLTKAKDLWSWELDIEGTETPDRIARIARRRASKGDVTLRKVDLSDFSAECARMRVLYNEALGGHWEFQEFGAREFEHVVAQLKPWIRPELLVIAEVDGTPVGTALAVPDMNPAIAVMRGRMLPGGVLRMIRASRRIDRARLLVLGMSAQHRRSGIDAMLYQHMHDAAQRSGIRGYELSWTLEDNTAINRAIAAMGGRRTKTHRMWRSDI